MFGFLKKEARVTNLKITPRPGEPFEAILGGKAIKVCLKKISADEELAISAFAEQTGKTFGKLVGSPDPEVQMKVVAEAGCRVFAHYALIYPDGKKVFPHLDDTRKANLEELAAISRVYDNMFSTTEEDLKN